MTADETFERSDIFSQEYVRNLLFFIISHVALCAFHFQLFACVNSDYFVFLRRHFLVHTVKYRYTVTKWLPSGTRGPLLIASAISWREIPFHPLMNSDIYQSLAYNS